MKNWSARLLSTEEKRSSIAGEIPHALQQEGRRIVERERNFYPMNKMYKYNARSSAKVLNN